MQDRENFLAMLSAIVDQAKSQNNVIAMHEIKELFESLGLDDDKLDYVCEYLAANQIRIQGYIQKEKDSTAQSVNVNDNTDNAEEKVINAEEKKALEKLKEKEEQLEQEEAAFIAMYLDDLDSLEPIEEEELERLMISLIEGDIFAKDKILQLYLQQVVEIAKDYQGKGVIIGDLIQEGNIALVTALEEICSGQYKEDTQSVEDTKNFIANKIISNLEFMINEQKDIKIVENRIVDKLNYLSDCMKTLAEDYRREATLLELADYANMDQEEITELVALAKNDLSMPK